MTDRLRRDGNGADVPYTGTNGSKEPCPVFTFLRPLCLLLVLAVPATADEGMTRAVSTTKALLSQAHQAMAGRDDRAALRRAVSQAFDFGLWERFLLQGREAEFDRAQRAEFRDLLPGFLANLYIDQFDRGLHAPPTVGEARKVRRDYLVASNFKRSGGRNLPVQWRLRDAPGRGARVIDMMVGGTSFLILKREEFRAVIDKSGADGLLAYMRRMAG